MRLKILLVPFSILLVLILVIGYIKPDIELLQEKRITLETKTAQSQNMTTLLSNIDALTTSLDNREESEKLVRWFLPETEDQDRIIDMFNYLGGQSGVFVNVMGMNTIDMKAGEEPILPPTNPLLVTTGDDGSVVAPVVPPLSKPKVQAYSAQVEVRGAYENIEDFFNRLAHMNRYHKIMSFSLSVPTTPKEGEENVLTGIFVSRFDHFPVRQVSSALNIPVFATATLDTTKLDALVSWINYTVPPLTSPDAGRRNPFQP